MGEIRFVGTGETRGYPYLVCKKFLDNTMNLAPLLTKHIYRIVPSVGRIGAGLGVGVGAGVTLYEMGRGFFRA